MEVGIVSTSLNSHCRYNIHNTHMGDGRPYRHTLALQQWRHHPTAYVKVNGEHLNVFVATI